MVTALASGMFCNVMKNRLKAETPKTPRRSRNFLLFPNGLIPFGSKYAKLRNNEIPLLKRISSWVGMWCRNLTHSCMSENANVLMSMNPIPLDMIGKCGDKVNRESTSLLKPA